MYFVLTGIKTEAAKSSPSKGKEQDAPKPGGCPSLKDHIGHADLVAARTTDLGGIVSKTGIFHQVTGLKVSLDCNVYSYYF